MISESATHSRKKNQAPIKEYNGVDSDGNNSYPNPFSPPPSSNSNQEPLAPTSNNKPLEQTNNQNDLDDIFDTVNDLKKEKNDTIKAGLGNTPGDEVFAVKDPFDGSVNSAEQQKDESSKQSGIDQSDNSNPSLTHPLETDSSDRNIDTNESSNTTFTPNLSRRKRRLLKELGPLPDTLEPRKVKPVVPFVTSGESKRGGGKSSVNSATSRRSSGRNTKRKSSKRSHSIMDDGDEMDTDDGIDYSLKDLYDEDDEDDNDEDEEDDDDGDDVEYEVETILNHQVYRNCVLRYEVKWKGYPDSENTFEPAKSFHLDCRDLCLQYWRSQPSNVPRPMNIPTEGNQEHLRRHSRRNSHTPPAKRKRSASPMAEPSWDISNSIEPLPTLQSISPRPPSMAATSSQELNIVRHVFKPMDITDIKYHYNPLHDADDNEKNNAFDICSDGDEHISGDTSGKHRENGSISSNRTKTSPFQGSSSILDLDHFRGYNYDDHDDDEDEGDDDDFSPPPKKTLGKSIRNSSTAADKMYADMARQKSITQNTVAANYKKDGFELAYSKTIRTAAKRLDWNDEFTIRNILPAKHNNSQLLAYLVWPSELKTVHLIQELHDKCAKKLCLYYEERIKYS
ncbi:hypothetical protein BC941DRAFT_431941 [Chlamydoabsidia padenii]|nr:hypothetical protein BC941DRAFT_431941 [Chlamydoabsidia padenii]